MSWLSLYITEISSAIMRYTNIPGVKFLAISISRYVNTLFNIALIHIYQAMRSQGRIRALCSRLYVNSCRVRRYYALSMQLFRHRQGWITAAAVLWCLYM
ncbi:hypothetical protein PILCRDRAFT_237610 [Piloderma croceum F 1598]|uniref:Uncharacterized protein n=1 Tax=Piloderma croceum (strain F 1598) TaxID=765440 RepID=A0A0C3BQG1_PILCF|nr:hypothetical protein PILCRDRAFT_237610 [Piloderma croceum F 1598]